VARSSSGGRGGLRTLALVAAVAIALASTAAVVLSDDPQTLRLAVVGALWAFVLAAFAAPRRQEPDAPAGDPGTALELRRTYEIELEKEVAARREYELQLEVYLRRELERGLAEDVAALREEVGRMRGEMIDRLDGELRMERIETTRLIGGSLRALQDEARRLGIGLPVPPELAADYPPEPARDGPARFGPADGPAGFGPAGFGPASGPADGVTPRADGGAGELRRAIRGSARGGGGRAREGRRDRRRGGGCRRNARSTLGEAWSVDQGPAIRGCGLCESIQGRCAGRTFGLSLLFRGSREPSPRPLSHPAVEKVDAERKVPCRLLDARRGSPKG